MARRSLTRGAWAAAACLLLSVPARAETIALVAPSGACLLRAAPPGTHAAALAALAAEAAALEGFVGRLAADAAAMRLATARERVPAFGDWAYGWVQSYVTSYRVLARGAAELARAAAGEGETGAGLAARLAEEMSEPIRTEFRRSVLAPMVEEGGLAADLAHVGAMLDAAWAEALARSAARLAALPAATGGSALPAAAGGLALPAAAGGAPLRLDLAAAGGPLAAALAATVPEDPVALLVEEGADTGTVFLRSMRPMAARLGAVLVRVSEAGSIIATGGAFGYALGGLPGTAVGLAGGIGASWAFDWLFNRVDAALNKGAFEAQALAAIARAERRVEAGAAAAARTGLAARLAAAGSGRGCP